ncbi:hypothetical protein ZWY2020_012127 [Hordeum vulgare]|nr:hypothetical protein ZWY2020_012127 [Hordeum vulgare]
MWAMRGGGIPMDMTPAGGSQREVVRYHHEHRDGRRGGRVETRVASGKNRTSKDLIFGEILEYHPQILKDYMNGYGKKRFPYARFL